MKFRPTTSLVLALSTALASITAGCAGTPASSTAGVAEPSVYPPTAELDLGAQMRFEASMPEGSGTPEWSVVEPDGGAIDSAGAYTAPDAEGVFHVAAKLGMFGSQTAEVRVRRGIRVSVTPQTATLAAGSSLNLSAAVSGTTNTAVTWSVSEAAGGTVSSGGTYVAPSTAGTYHVVATSVANPLRTGYATVTVTAPTPPPPPAVISVAVTPATATVAASGTLQLQATVSGSSNTAVLWSVQEAAGGSVSSSGLYSAPSTAGTYHVVATSSADSSKTATATLTVTAPPPPAPVVAISVTPATASIATGATLQLKAAVTGSSNVAVTWSVKEGTAGGSVTSNGLYAAPSTAGTYHVVATSSADSTKTAVATVTVTAPTPPPTQATTPPDSGTVAWAPAAGDTSFVNVKDYGVKGDGVTDDTAAFNNAAATGKKLFVPKPASFYKLTGRIVVLNSVYGDGSMPEFRMFGATGDRAHAMLFVGSHTNGAQQLVIQGLTLDGQWNGGSQGEWSANIDIRGGSTNVLVQYNTLKNPYGDCVQLADDAIGPVTNITIRKNTMLNPYRCDVSFQWVNGVVVDGNHLNKNNTYVTALDIEPCGGTQQSDSNIQIINNVFDVPISRTLSLVDGSGLGGDNILVSGNSGSAQDKPIANGNWTHYSVVNNTWTIKYP